jgi:hypothetical protein
MEIRVFDLDGSVVSQGDFVARFGPTICPCKDWGPYVRMACSLARFRRFVSELAQRLGSGADDSPQATLYGSGDFHHVSLALLRRQKQPFNLLVLDNHPDWMRGVPFLHCGTWLNHASRLPLVQHIFHVGGDVDFDNYYRWLAPWRLLRDRKIIVVPALRRYQFGPWATIHHQPLRQERGEPCGRHRLDDLILPFRASLRKWPLYISVDKDVLTHDEAVVNWDSGHLTLAEVEGIIRCFIQSANGHLAGMDVLGDWSPVEVRGLFRRALHLTEHPPLTVDSAEAARRNDRINRVLVDTVREESRIVWRHAC